MLFLVRPRGIFFRGVSGSSQMYAELRSQDMCYSRERTARLMREMELCAKPQRHIPKQAHIFVWFGLNRSGQTVSLENLRRLPSEQGARYCDLPKRE